MVMNRRGRAVFRKALPVVLLAALLCSCGIFSRRPSNEPNGNGTTDPLNFSELVAGTPYQFASLQYADLFQNNDSIYFDANSGYSTQEELTNRLSLITNTYPHIHVNWIVGNSIANSPDSVTVTVAKYDIILNTSTNSSDTADSGHAIFTLVQNAGWHISYWHDYPWQGASFFSPNYRQ
jgi:hypothetical protein